MLQTYIRAHWVHYTTSPDVSHQQAWSALRAHVQRHGVPDGPLRVWRECGIVKVSS